MNVQVTRPMKKSSSKSITPAISESSDSLPLKSKVTENDFKDPGIRALAIAAKSYMRFEIAINDVFPLLTLPNLHQNLIWKVIDATITVRRPPVRSHLRTLSYSIFISLYVHTYAAYHIYLTTQSLHRSVVTALHGVSDVYDITLLEHSLVVVSSIISLPLLVRYVLTL